jgi:Metallo-peptidase family M12/Secretion system C-terminal sorting domain
MTKIYITLAMIGSLNLMNSQSNQSFWVPIQEYKIQKTGVRDIVPNKYKTYHLDVTSLKNKLLQAPNDAFVSAKNSTIIVSLPMPNGIYERFTIVEAPVMDELLQSSYPNIRTYSIHGLDDVYASGKLDITEFGFHGMIRSPKGDVFIDPYCKWNVEDYISYYVTDFEKPLHQRSFCEGAFGETNLLNKTSAPTATICAGQNLRKYRLAVGCTGQYAVAATGSATPTTAQVLAKVVTSVNRVDGVFESEVAVRMVLVNTTTITLYVKTATTTAIAAAPTATAQPYTGNGNGGTLIGESQNVITNLIGTANFDIGHTFSTGGGGLAQLGCVCSATNKARGITGSSNPVGDPYDIDYVAHEIGHQFSGNHTFRANTGSCAGNANNATSVEPGSGITIMAYAGICSATNNLASNSIAFFHSISYDEIMNFTNLNGGNTCPVTTTTGNNPPVVTGSANFVIPSSTPFALTGSATDPNGDALTYQWEEADAGTSGANWNSGAKPFFMSYVPITSPTRLFPKLSSILTGVTAYTTVIGEFLPTTAQTLKFRLTARDNKMGGGGVCYAACQITVSATGPFSVTSQSVIGITYASGSVQNITWNVSGTNTAPVNCANVNIYVSKDAGLTYSLVLANTPNDGNENVTLPNLATTSNTCRVKVESVGNIFFDLNDKNFTITLSTGLNQLSNANTLGLQLYPNPFSGSVKIDIASSQSLQVDKTVINVYDILGKIVYTENIKLSDNFTKTFDFSSLANGTYVVEVTDGTQKSVVRMIKL